MGTLYIGVTSNLNKRTYEHKSKAVKGFTERYGVHMLVYFEVFEDPITAIAREKQLKKWKREWKIQLIESQNLEWVDLSNVLI